MAAHGHDIDATIHENLADLEEASRYAAWILELISPYVAGRILEVGAGRGTYSAGLAARGVVMAVEPSAAGHAALADRLAALPGATAVRTDLTGGLTHGPFDTVVLLNVLEHIDDDRGALGAIADGLDTGGHLVLWVPAFPLLLGSFDRSIGHHRRYRRRPLEAVVRSAGLDVVQARYRNLPGWFAWLLVVRVLGQRPTTSRLARTYDRIVIPAVRVIERVLPAPFGQSLMLVARKP